ncbi:A/G-specific adenine glycosylase [Demequina sp. SYSU T00039]|uniref:Adenine DNA glycosylase n=1 Tax=Demequina lignilytica TaxID=3051663 RepID=A0AAW7M8K7_9MICO|nr:MULTISPECIES: A/G-specific adenine glycosylase [unclassified Demequina]MDN4477971.1 A/G-specific adenine glycosylase [Demequina sp. SYSU T00039-1]MDN4487880.1 A/G-specific adenine glycosylase [Demequina sp. SYSU T00039]MDN4490737.1 A/G-specific adenine glycosylase [Demequina sp. SYSU T00068]
MPHESESAAARDARMVAAVLEWFAQAGRDLPWRGGSATPWGVLVSEIMLQQTPVVRVEPVWREWMARWPAPVDLAAAEQADAVRAWGRLGYPRRAKRLWECAGALVDRHGGVVPRTYEELVALPGIGDYTAAAVVAFAHGGRSVVLDTNVRRVIGRAWHGRALPAAHQTVGERAHAASLVPRDDAGAAEWAVASMELGALVCTARVARCDECPLARECAWLAQGRPGLDLAPRRTQPWHGTDRQVRGRVMALLRAASSPVNVTGHATLEDVEPGQLDRCLEGLLADGLIRLDDADRGTYTL